MYGAFESARTRLGRV